MVGRIIRDFRQLRFALSVYYRRKARGRRTSEQEIARTLRELEYERELARRLGWRR